jgi:5-methylcytosine-specific restriction enzyme A
MRPCLDCGELSDGSRCPAHRRHWERRSRPSANARGYTSKYRKLRAELIKEHISRYGLVCPGFGDRLVHSVAVEDLTVDHIIDLSSGGTNDRRNLTVLCRQCNIAKGGKNRTVYADPGHRFVDERPASDNWIRVR